MSRRQERLVIIFGLAYEFLLGVMFGYVLWGR